MVLTTLFLCLQPNKNKFLGKWKVLRALRIGLVMMTLSTLTGCGSGGDGQGSEGGGSSPAGGASVSLAWDPVQEAGLIGYFVHYGTHPSNSHGSCAYALSKFTSSASITVTGLAPNTRYYFTVSAYNGLESACSSEVSTVTGSV